MPRKISASSASYFLGFDGGGTKTEAVLADAEGRVVARGAAGPSKPPRSGNTRAWFSISEAADAVLARGKIHASYIRGICAGLGGAGRAGVARRLKVFFERSFPNAAVSVTTDLEIALEAAFGSGEGILLLAGTGCGAFGRGAHGRTARAGGREPWISDEASAFDFGRRALQAMAPAEEHRGADTALSQRIFKWHECRDWDSLLERIAKNPDDVFPKTFPLITEVAEAGDAVAREILAIAAASLASMVKSVTNELGWRDRHFSIAKVGGVFDRSGFFDAALESNLKKARPRARWVPVEISPAEAAVRMAVRSARAKGHVA